MSARRYAAKRDANERAIIDALRAAGCLVAQVSDKGIPDLLVWTPHEWRIVLLEVKDGAKQKSMRELTRHQYLWHAEWAGAGAPVYVVTDIESALWAVGVDVGVDADGGDEGPRRRRAHRSDARRAHDKANRGRA